MQTKEDLPPTFEWATTYLRDYMPLSASPMHKELCDRFDQMIRKRGRRESKIAPRGNAKTTWTSKALPIYSAVHACESYILLVSDTASQSEKNLASVKYELETNPLIQEHYPWAAGKGPEWGAASIVTRSGVRVEAVGTGSKVRGRTSLQHRPSLIICDDLQNDESVESPIQRDKDYEWLNRVLIPAGNKDTNILVVGTALHRGDIQQRLKKTPGWHNDTFKSIVRWPDALRSLWLEWSTIYSDPLIPEDEREVTAKEFYEQHFEAMNEGAEVLWPEKESLYDLMSLREVMGAAAFEAEKQGSPTSTKQNEWPEQLFGEHIWYKRLPQTKLRVIAVDMSKGKSEKSDYTAIVSLAIGNDGLLYVDADLARIDASIISTRSLDHYEAFMPDAIGFEINGFQELVQSVFQAEAKKRGIPVATFGLNNTLNKLVRIRKLSPFLRNGRLRFKAGSKGAELLVDQLRDFPTGNHDDGPDALEMAIRLVQYVLNPDQQPDDADMPVTYLDVRP